MHTMLINKPPDAGTKTSRHPLHQVWYLKHKTKLSFNDLIFIGLALLSFPASRSYRVFLDCYGTYHSRKRMPDRLTRYTQGSSSSTWLSWLAERCQQNVSWSSRFRWSPGSGVADGKRLVRKELFVSHKSTSKTEYVFVRWHRLLSSCFDPRFGNEHDKGIPQSNFMPLLVSWNGVHRHSWNFTREYC